MLERVDAARGECAMERGGGWKLRNIVLNIIKVEGVSMLIQRDLNDKRQWAHVINTCCYNQRKNCIQITTEDRFCWPDISIILWFQDLQKT